MSEQGVYLGREDTDLTLGPPDIIDLDANYIRMPIQLRATDVVARASLDLAGWGGWVVAFLGYFDDLSASWRGWDGEKVWSDDSAAVAFSATHNGLSEILLAVKLRPSYGSHDRGTWELDVVVPVEAGRMPDVATAARRMLSHAGVPLEWGNGAGDIAGH